MVGRKVEKSASRKISHVKKAKVKQSGRKNALSHGNRSKPSVRGACSSQSNYEYSSGGKEAPGEAKMMQEKPEYYAEEAKLVSQSLTALIKSKSHTQDYLRVVE